MRSNMVSVLLIDIGYAYMKLHFYDEAWKCFNYVCETYPIAGDAFLRRSQSLLYKKQASISDLIQGSKDAEKAIELRPKEKFYKEHQRTINT